MPAVSRRSFHRAFSLLAAGAALPFYNEAALAQRAMGGRRNSGDAVKINSNENPMGPCPEALEAMSAIAPQGGRYGDSQVYDAQSALAEIEGVDTNYVKMYAGSSDPLHRFVIASCNKDKPFVYGEPGYEAGGRAAAYVGAQAIGVPLVPGTMVHDVKAMVKAHPTPGILYVCNPNNPTGTVNTKEEIEWLVANKPAGSIVLLDEAYIHLSSKATPASYLVKQGKDVVILRTFSKLYGMAGIRAGAVIARPELQQRTSMYTTGFLPVQSMVAATASLRSKNLVAERRKIIADIREDTFAFLQKNNIEFLPSDANMFMMNAKRPGRVFASQMAAKGIMIGRTWPSMPNWPRVTIGTREEMQKFQAACLECYHAADSGAGL
jgi:histidinol-phosphate aminotransferase